jgi:mRNA interferase RelE/StbE
MILKIDKSFEKDFKKVGNQKLNPKLLMIIENIKRAEKLTDIKNIKKLKGTSDFYRIRLGDYRIGIIIIKKEVQLIRFLHRKEIYRYFP